MRCGAILGSPLRPPGRHLPVWVRRVSQFRLVAFTAFQTRVPLVSIDCKGSAISPFWLEDFAHCPQASYPRLCRDLTHAAYPSHHYSYAALSEQHQLPLKGALGGPAKTPILNFGNQAYKHRARFSPEPLAVGMVVKGQHGGWPHECWSCPWYARSRLVRQDWATPAACCIATRCQRAESGRSSQASAYLSGSTAVQKAVTYCWQRCRYSLASVSSCASLLALASKSRICVTARVSFIGSTHNTNRCS